MIILQIVLAAAVLGLGGLAAYWFGVVIKAGPKVTEDEINKDPRFK